MKQAETPNFNTPMVLRFIFGGKQANQSRAHRFALIFGGNIEGVRQNPKQSPAVNSAIGKGNLALGEDGNGKIRD